MVGTLKRGHGPNKLLMHVVNDRIGLPSTCRGIGRRVDKADVTFQYKITDTLSASQHTRVFQVGPPDGVWLRASIYFGNGRWQIMEHFGSGMLQGRWGGKGINMDNVFACLDYGLDEGGLPGAWWSSIST